MKWAIAHLPPPWLRHWSSWIGLVELPLEMMFLTYFNNILAAESIKNRLKNVQKLYKQ
jgi:hypothetical protein